MAFLILGLSIIVGIGSLVCFIMVIVKMFQNGQTGLGVACLILILCGIGPLIAFVFGWIKSGEWNIKNLMLAWTACIVVGILLNIAGLAVAPPALN